MKSERWAHNFYMALPVISLVASFGIVYDQYARRDRLKDELTAASSEYAKMEQRYSELSRALERKYKTATVSVPAPQAVAPLEVASPAKTSAETTSAGAPAPTRSETSPASLAPRNASLLRDQK